MDRPTFPPGTTSLLARHLDDAVFARVVEARGTAGWTLADLIRSGVENPDSSVGLYVGGADCFTAFAPLLDPVLEDLAQAPAGSRGDPAVLPADLALGRLGPAARSTRIRAARNLAGHPFPAALDLDGRRAVEAEVRTALEAMTGDLAGTFHPLEELSDALRAELEDAHLLFHGRDRFMRAAGMLEDWPAGRGIFLAADRRFVVWVNEEDHLRVISIQPDDDLGQVWERLHAALDALGAHLTWARHPAHGILASCPSNVGTGMRASVHVALPALGTDPEGREARAAELGLALRGTSGEHTAVVDGVCDLSLKVRVGVPADQHMTALREGVAAMMAAEQEAAGR